RLPRGAHPVSFGPPRPPRADLPRHGGATLMGAVLRRSFMEPLRSPVSAAILGAAMLLCWLIVALTIHEVEDADNVEWVLGQLGSTLHALLFLPVLVLAGPIVASEVRDRTLMLNLLQPIERVAYYTSRVGGRALFAGSYFAVTIGGVMLVIRLAVAGGLQSGRSPVPPDTAWTLVFTGLSLLTMTWSLAALAPVSSTRYGHVALWLGLFAMLWQARSLEQVSGAAAGSRALAWLVREVVGPFLV